MNVGIRKLIHRVFIEHLFYRQQKVGYKWTNQCLPSQRKIKYAVVVQSLSHAQLFVTPWTAAHQASLSITNSWRLLRLTSIKSVMPSTISSSAALFSSCLQSFPASGSFPRVKSGGQRIGVLASASVLPKNIQGWFPLGLTGLISLQSKGHSRVFINM